MILLAFSGREVISRIFPIKFQQIHLISVSGQKVLAFSGRQVISRILPIKFQQISLNFRFPSKRFMIY